MKLLYKNKTIIIFAITLIIILSLLINILPYTFCKFICWLGYCEESII